MLSSGFEAGWYPGAAVEQAADKLARTLGVNLASVAPSVWHAATGDTDTVAALVGGLMGCELTAEQVRAELPWHQLVVLPEPASAIADMANALATTRTIQSV